MNVRKTPKTYNLRCADYPVVKILNALSLPEKVKKE